MLTGQHIFQKSRQSKFRLAVAANCLLSISLTICQPNFLPADLLQSALIQPAFAKSHSNSPKSKKEKTEKGEKREQSGYSQSKEARLLGDQLLKAIGGYAAFKRFNDIPCRAKGKIVQTSSLSNGINTFDCDILLKREKQKITISFLGQPLTTVYDGVMCWTKQGDTILPSDQITAKRIAEDITHGLLLLEKVASPTTHMEVGEPTTVDGQLCDTLKVWAEDGEPTAFYVDKVNHYVVGSSYAGVDLEQGVKVEKRYTYSDFRLVENTQQPFKVVEYSGDKKVSETLVSEVTVDPTVTDDIFVMPKERPSARLAAGAITVPFEYTSSEILVTTKVNGLHDLRFIVDTGATQCLLDKSIATKIGATSLGSDSGVSMTTGSGTIKTGAVLVKSLALGELEIANVPFAVADLNSFGNIQGPKPAGLIGANVLKRYLMTVDYENEKLRFADPTQVDVPEGAIVINTKPSLGMSGLAVEGTIDGKQKVTFLIDTGAAFNNISETKVKALLWGPVLKVGILKGLDGKPVETGAARFDYLDLGKHRIEKPVFSIAPQLLEGQGEAGIISSKDLAIIGNPLLSRYKVTFDYRNQRLFFEQSAIVKKKNELTDKIDAIRFEWLRTRNANQAIRDLTTVLIRPTMKICLVLKPWQEQS
jgi:clan AA aspartic protease (TIGR02281 family)